MSFPVRFWIGVRDPVDFHEGSQEASTAVRHGWVALRSERGESKMPMVS